MNREATRVVFHRCQTSIVHGAIFLLDLKMLQFFNNIKLLYMKATFCNQLQHQQAMEKRVQCKLRKQKFGNIVFDKKLRL